MWSIVNNGPVMFTTSLSLQVLLTLYEGSTTHAHLIRHVETNLKTIKFTTPLLHIFIVKKIHSFALNSQTCTNVSLIWKPIPSKKNSLHFAWLAQFIIYQKGTQHYFSLLYKRKLWLLLIHFIELASKITTSCKSSIFWYQHMKTMFWYEMKYLHNGMPFK